METNHRSGYNTEQKQFILPVMNLKLVKAD